MGKPGYKSLVKDDKDKGVSMYLSFKDAQKLASIMNEPSYNRAEDAFRQRIFDKIARQKGF